MEILWIIYINIRAYTFYPFVAITYTPITNPITHPIIDPLIVPNSKCLTKLVIKFYCLDFAIASYY